MAKRKTVTPKTRDCKCQIQKQREKTKLNQEVCKTFRRKIKLSPASMEAMLRLHPLSKCIKNEFLDLLGLPGIILGQNNDKKPHQRKFKTNKQNPTKIKPRTQQERSEEDMAAFGMGFSWLHGTNWSSLHLKTGFLPTQCRLH